ncbi:MAG: hypothetical protein WA418_24600 [Bradyrhizobium sp.]
MSPDPTHVVGFTHPGRVARFQRRRAAMLAELVTSAALVLCIIVAVVALSMGVAQARAADTITEASGLPVAALFSAVLVGMGGLTALISAGGDEPRE